MRGIGAFVSHGRVIVECLRLDQRRRLWRAIVAAATIAIKIWPLRIRRIVHKCVGGCMKVGLGVRLLGWAEIPGACASACSLACWDIRVVGLLIIALGILSLPLSMSVSVLRCVVLTGGVGILGRSTRAALAKLSASGLLRGWGIALGAVLRLILLKWVLVRHSRTQN